MLAKFKQSRRNNTAFFILTKRPWLVMSLDNVAKKVNMGNMYFGCLSELLLLPTTCK